MTAFSRSRTGAQSATGTGRGSESVVEVIYARKRKKRRLRPLFSVILDSAFDSITI